MVLPRPARGAGTLIPSAQRFVWAAKQPLGNAAWGASLPSDRALLRSLSPLQGGMDHRCKGKGRAELRPVRRPPVTSPPLPQSVPSPARKLEAGKGLARLAQAEQPLGRGSAISCLGADLELRRSGSSFGPSQYRLASTRRRPDSILPLAGSGLPILGTEHLPGALCSGTGSPALGLCSP